MIRFACPRCRVTLKVDDHRAGRKSHCPGCGQRIQVPLPPRHKTLLAAAIEPPPSHPPALALPPEPPPGEVPQTTTPNARAVRVLLALGGVTAVLLLVIVAALACLLAMWPGTGPLAALTQQAGKPSGHSGRQQPGPAEADRIVVRQGDVRVTVLLIEASPDRAASPAVIYFLAENLSETRKVDFLPSMGIAKVADELGNKYRPLMALPIGNVSPLNFLGVGTLRPGDFVIAPLPCESPVDRARLLTVELPGVEGKPLQFAIPLKEEKATYKRMFANPGQGEETYTVLFKRDGFQDWFTKLDRRMKDLFPFP